MESIIIYLLKASALLGIFYLGYLLLLKKETSFQLNRKYLAYGIITATILPFIYFTRKVFIEQKPQSLNFLVGTTETSKIPMETPVDWWQITGILYFIITGLFLLRFSIQLYTVIKIIISHDFQKNSGLKYLEVSENQLPFSFFNYIIYNPTQHSHKDLALILEHEKVHAKQLHSADILLVNLVSCLLWFNPFAWVYKKSVEENLEFIADRETVKSKAELKQYQHALVKVSIADLKPALTNHFYKSFIKKRILMLNKKSSTQSPAWKLSLLMPVLLAFLLLFNVKTEANVRTSTEKEVSTQIEYPREGMAITINAKTSEEDLEKLENIFEKDGRVLKFFDLKFNSEKIISIRSTLTDPVKGITRTYNQSNSNGIKPVKIFVNKDGNIGYETLENADISVVDLHKQMEALGDNPLYIIEGKPIKANKLRNKYVKIMGPIEIRTGIRSVALYGSSGQDGSIDISKGKILDKFTDDQVFETDKNFSQNYLIIDKNGKSRIMKVDAQVNVSEEKTKQKKNKSIEDEGFQKKSDYEMMKDKPGKVEVTGTGFFTEDPEEIKEMSGDHIIGFQSTKLNSRHTGSISESNNTITSDQIFIQQSNPLYVLNGEVQKRDFEKEKIDPKNILKINVLKGTSATDKYGEAASDGVIEIYTKKFEGDTSHPVKTDLYVLHKNSNEENIKNLKKMIKSGADIETEFTGIKRNSEGDITAVSIKATTKDGKMASASFQNSEGIPHVIIGLTKDGKLIVSSNYGSY